MDIEINDESLSDEDSESSSDSENTEKKVYLPGTNLKDGEELVADDSAYRLLHQASTGAPCLSFDVVKDRFEDSRENYPLSMYLVAGTQAPRTHVNNLLIMKMYNLHGKKFKEDDDKLSESDEDDDEDDNDDDDDKGPKMRVASIKHQGCVNRVRYKKKKSSFSLSFFF